MHRVALCYDASRCNFDHTTCDILHLTTTLSGLQHAVNKTVPHRANKICRKLEIIQRRIVAQRKRQMSDTLLCGGPPYRGAGPRRGAGGPRRPGHGARRRGPRRPPGCRQVRSGHRYTLRRRGQVTGELSAVGLDTVILSSIYGRLDLFLHTGVRH